MECRKKDSSRNLQLAAILAASLFVIGMAVTPGAQAQTFQVIHTFTHGADGANPLGRLTIDGGGHLYGSTYAGGVQYEGGFGVVFKMSPAGSGWTFAPIYTFSPQGDGGDPYAGVLFGPDGILYGTTSNGPSVFTVRPSATRPTTVLSPWTLNFLYDFSPFTVYPGGDLVFDSAGNIYGATATGGNRGCFNNEGCGMIYELTPSAGGWVETPLYIFQGEADGSGPTGVTFDAAGDLLGTATNGGAHNGGTIFQLTRSGSGWTKSTVYDFNCEGNGGCGPVAGLTSDGAGNFYGSTVASSGYSGVIFELSPSNGNWTYNMLVQIPPQYQYGPNAPLTIDSAGNLYGTIGTRDSDRLLGAVFKVTPGNGGWSFTSLHDFTGLADGCCSASTVAIGANGNLYGTAIYGGQYGSGVVWEITP